MLSESQPKGRVDSIVQDIVCAVSGGTQVPPQPILIPSADNVGNAEENENSLCLLKVLFFLTAPNHM